MDKFLSLLGLAKKAGRLEVGEEPTGAAARARDAKALLLAADAADNTQRRAAHFAEAGGCPCLKLPHTKDELGAAVGRSSCAMLAVTDAGFAAALAERLAVTDEARYGEAAAQLRSKEERAAQRRKEQEQHEKNLRAGKAPRRREPDAPPEAKPTAKKPAGANKRPSRRRTEAERARAHRERGKQEARRRFESSRPVKKGKGSARGGKP